MMMKCTRCMVILWGLYSSVFVEGDGTLLHLASGKFAFPQCIMSDDGPSWMGEVYEGELET